MEKILRIIKKLIPSKVFKTLQPVYHYLLSSLGAVIYRFPANKLRVIAVTGTKGKSTTAEVVNSILEENGFKTALSSTIRFKVGVNSRPNKYKMSMPGRFFMQKFLANAVKEGCTHAVVEITSEGVKQFRHKYIYLDSLIFTNLAPEHIESHGSYEKYLEAKLKIVDLLQKKKGFLVWNADDDEGETFKKKAEKNNLENIPYTLSDAKPINFGSKTELRFHKNTLYSDLPGEFNVYNILSAITLADHMGISHEVIKEGVENLSTVPGRVQKVEGSQDFDVIVDYAHTPESLEELYKAFSNKKKVCVLGNTGGGRDTWKRPVMAQIAEKYCDAIILTNEDPYDEDPEKIVNEMKEAIKEKNPEVIMDRREAISTAISKADSDSVVLISGKGTDPYIMEANGKKTPWGDYEVAKEELGKLGF
jgi:UDP-N-acetylmuramoyl-L-alanyl-D-glutamate--2,6-diaminopimelate ligase